jgi:hypothetical protein
MLGRATWQPHARIASRALGAESSVRGAHVEAPEEHASVRPNRDWQRSAVRGALLRADYGAIAAALFGLWWLHHIGAWSTLRPRNVSWIASDWGANELGWLFFRNDPWSFPIGSCRSYLYPVGSSVGFSDSIPVVAVLAKLASPLLPIKFQYIGIWFAVCFVLQGYVGAKIAGLFWRDPISRAAGGALFVMTPTLLLRIGHASLCAHWLLTVPIWLHLKRPTGRGMVPCSPCSRAPFTPTWR